ncbi:hypothetical protein [Variovorax sp. dw_954]|uniref:hypothetical protein n=1 Tax=Variovorax sp. dw_954 TaxID=2720078 RepID=UPI001BD52ECC|nr:hypothetical protein [Variovorax sp. dw_954]
MGRQSVDNSALERWRNLDSAHVLGVIADFAKRDAEYVPTKSALSTRWHATVGGRDFEILCTGAKFLDTRANKGGGGAVDLVMHLTDSDFKAAAKVLRSRGL